VVGAATKPTFPFLFLQNSRDILVRNTSAKNNILLLLMPGAYVYAPFVPAVPAQEKRQPKIHEIYL
jgi:hypothetical protein